MGCFAIQQQTNKMVEASDTIILWCFGTFNIIIVFEHLIGAYLLFRRRREFTILLFFSTCNLIYACVNIGYFSVIAAKCGKRTTDIYVIYATSMRIPFYWLMIMLTIERFLVVYIHLRYSNSWFDRHKEKLCIASWVTYIVFCVSVNIAYVKLDSSSNFYNDLLRTKYTLLGHLLIVVIFVSVYGYIYWKIRILKTQVVMNDRLETRKWKVFVPFFIVLSFLIFRGITELVAVFHLKTLKVYIVWIYSFDFFVNGIVYIFLQPVLRRDFKRIFCRARNRGESSLKSSRKKGYLIRSGFPYYFLNPSF